jgi:hypothetical protein
MGQKLDIFKIWPPDFAQKNFYRILNLSETINELILPKIFFLSKYRFLKKTCFVSKIAHDFFFNITFYPNNQNTSRVEGGSLGHFFFKWNKIESLVYK